MKRHKIEMNYTVIGEVYLNSDGVWMAQPEWSNYSCSFPDRDSAIMELMLHFQNQKWYNSGKGMPVQ